MVRATRVSKRCGESLWLLRHSLLASWGPKGSNSDVQLELQFQRPPVPPMDVLVLGSRIVPLHFFRNLRARRYILRVRPDGSARVTIPRGGSKAFARDFAQRQGGWVENQLLKQAGRVRRVSAWTHGTEILFHGQLVPLQVAPGPLRVQLAEQTIILAQWCSDLRPAVERHLCYLASKELPARTWELAAVQGVPVRRVAVRNQRSRWGSCSVKGTVSLNWRLIQTPDSVRDYLILHELMHLKEMNHSPRFWSLVEQVCPSYVEAEKWLKRHALDSFR